MQILRDSGYRALESLKRSGAVGAIGIGVNEREVLLEAMEWGDWDAFLLAGRYTLLEQAPLEDLLPKCPARGVSIVGGGPFNSGMLAGRDTWNYDTAQPGIAAKAKAVGAVCERHGVPLPAAAVQFPLAHPAVVPGHPGAARRRGSRGQPEAAPAPDPAGTVGGFAGREIAAPRRADPELVPDRFRCPFKKEP
jgi:D-threo-aldose 1-dehydrogenase